MTDLTDDELRARLKYAMGEHGLEPFVEPLRELQNHRAVAAADKERVRSVVREAALALLDERKLYIVAPQPPTMGEVALEAYGFGKACDAVALQGDDLQALLAAIADRAAEQLAGATACLSAGDVAPLRAARDSYARIVRLDYVALFDRLLAAQEGK